MIAPKSGNGLLVAEAEAPCAGTRGVGASMRPKNKMWLHLLYTGFETCFSLGTQGARSKKHLKLKSRFCAVLEKTQNKNKKGWGVII